MRSIPQKQADKPLIDWLDENEMQAILDAPNTGTVAGLRDRAMLHVCYAAGLRVSELTALTLDSLSGPQLEYIRIIGKGRRERELPLWKETKSVLNEWLDVRPAVNNRYLFLNARGRPLSPDGFAYILKTAHHHRNPRATIAQGQAGDPSCAPSFNGNDDLACHRGHPKGLALAWARGYQDHRSIPSGEPGRKAANPWVQCAAIDPPRDIHRRKRLADEGAWRKVSPKINAE